jgi:hypothetical protein
LRGHAIARVSGHLAQTALHQADVPPVSEDDVIAHRDAEEATAFNQLAGDPNIFGRRLRIAAGVVVDQDYAGGRLRDGGAEDLAGVNQR